MKEERFPHTRKPLHWQRRRGALRSHGGERSNRGAEGKAERFPHRGPVPASTHQPERLVCSPAGEGGGWLREHSLKGASAPQLDGRESGKKSGAAEEARDFFLPLCFLVREERGFRGRLKELQRRARAAATSADPRDGHETLRLLLPPPRSLCASTGHSPLLPSPPGSLCSPPLPGSHDPGTTSPGEHMARLRLLQHHVSLCRRRLAPHSVPLPPPGLSEPEPPNQLLL